MPTSVRPLRTRRGNLKEPALVGPLADFPLTIVDVETTGQSALYGRIIEVAAIRLEGGQIVERFQTLVNPERYITPMIEGLTGITNEAVADSPRFSRIARKLYKILDGATFVAHNARFDYSFIRSEFARAGIPFTAKCLCTVKLSRKLFPGERHHDLSSVIERHDLECASRHRAMGDAEVLLNFLRLAGEAIDHTALANVVHAILKSSSLPAGVEKTMLDGLPEAPGVYFFYGKQGELLYVGKSVNIRDRVRSHFSSDQSSAKEMTMCQQVQRVEHRETAGELGALLLESRLIKELRPLFNAMARRKRKLIVARRVTDRKGYYRVSLEETDFIEPQNTAPILAVFKHQKQAEEYLSEIARTHQLCHKLLGLEQGRSYCFSYHLKQCRGACAGEENPLGYNLRLEEAFGERRVKAWPFEGGIAIEEKSIEGTRGEVFLVDNWCLLSSFRYSEFGIDDRVKGSHRFDYDSYKILSRYLMNNSHRRHIRQLRKEQFEEMLSSVVSKPG